MGIQFGDTTEIRGVTRAWTLFESFENGSTCGLEFGGTKGILLNVLREY